MVVTIVGRNGMFRRLVIHLVLTIASLHLVIGLPLDGVGIGGHISCVAHLKRSLNIYMLQTPAPAGVFLPRFLRNKNLTFPSLEAI